MFIYIIAGIAVVAVLFVIVVASRPSEFTVTRSAPIDAPAGVAFEQVNDLHNWEAWSPWAKLDPNAKQTYEGPASGTGAAFAWSGNNKIGKGRMTITESRPNELVRIRLDFEKPFKATNASEFTFRPEGNRTAVTWTMSGRMHFVCKAMGLFMNSDKWMGAQFEKGLAQMNSVVGALVAH